MKVCDACGDTYSDHVDFCFNDGEVLVAADAPDRGARRDHGSLVSGGDRPARAPDLETPSPPGHSTMSSPDPAPTARSPTTPGPQRSQTSRALRATPVPRSNHRSLQQTPGAPLSATERGGGGGATATPPADGPQGGENAPAEPADAGARQGIPAGGVAPDTPRSTARRSSGPPSLDRSPEEADTAPLLRPVRAEPPSPSPPTARPNEPASSATPARPSVNRAAGPGPTFEPERAHERERSGMLAIGVAAVVGVLFVAGSGVALFAMGPGLGARSGGPVAAEQHAAEPPPPVAAPLVAPAPVVEQAPEAAPEPAPEVSVAAEPAPAPAPVRPAPSTVAPTHGGGAAEATPAPTSVPAEAPVPVPVPAPAAAAANPATVKVAFTSDPPGAEVWVDGVRVLERTPGTATLAPGEHRWEMRLADHDGSSGELTAEGASTAVKGTLAAKPAIRVGKVLFFHAGFTGSVLYIDGEDRGALPATIAQLQEGRHSFKIVNPATGEEFSLSREIALKRGGGGPTIVHLDQ